MKRGFTLVELLVVIGIIAVLISILLPALSGARREGQRIQCLSNLRQMTIALNAYANENQGYCPSAYFGVMSGTTHYAFNWDFTLITNTLTGDRQVVPGVLWGTKANVRVQQCPTFQGKSNTLMDPYTGYNYNTSYIGRGQAETVVTPTKLVRIRKPEATVVFGDGQWKGGANKYMRSPAQSPYEPVNTPRAAGTQGYRHRSQTNVAYVDGHAESLRAWYTGGFSVWTGTGFVSETNDIYDLD